MYVLGIAGPIASGKSLLLSFLAELGALTLRADDVARELVRPGSHLLAKIASEFGSEFLTPSGELDRKRMARLIFTNHDARRRYEALFHPVLHEALVERIARARSAGQAQILAVEAAIMEQLRLVDVLDGLAYVDAPEEVRVRRLVERLGYAEEEARRRVRAQAGLERVRERARWLVDGGASKENLKRAAAQIYQDILKQEASDQ